MSGFGACGLLLTAGQVYFILLLLYLYTHIQAAASSSGCKNARIVFTCLLTNQEMEPNAERTGDILPTKRQGARKEEGSFLSSSSSVACSPPPSRSLSLPLLHTMASRALVVLLALALVAFVSVVAQQERDPNLRLIKLSEEDSGAWMTQAQIDGLAQRRIGFMDVTVRSHTLSLARSSPSSHCSAWLMCCVMPLPLGPPNAS